jgi:hypothetical protein
MPFYNNEIVLTELSKACYVIAKIAIPFDNINLVDKGKNTCVLFSTCFQDSPIFIHESRRQSVVASREQRTCIFFDIRKKGISRPPLHVRV